MKSLKGIKVLLGPSTFALHDNKPLDHLIEAGCEVIENPYKRKITKPELLELLSDNVSGLIAGLEPLDFDVLKMSKLKVISRCGSGLSNVDLEAAAEMNITVCSTPEAPVQAVAELTLGSMLSLLRHIHQMDRDLHSGEWVKRIGIQLKNKTVVIIGFGRIGQCLTDLLMPFQTKIMAVDPYFEGSLYNNDNVSLVSLEEALPKADIITIHSSGETCILGEKELSLIKKGTFLLNAGRGNLVDEAALIKVIENGYVAGAWLDTFMQEPYRGPLTEYSQVLLTPHVGSYTAECRSRMETEAVNNLITVLRNE